MQVIKKCLIKGNKRKMILDNLINYYLNGYKKKKGKIFFIPRCFNCGKNCTETGIRRFVSYNTITYYDICADCYCKINVEQKKKDRYKNWLKGEQVFITSREIKKK